MLLMNAGKAVAVPVITDPTMIPGMQLWLDTTDVGNITVSGGDLTAAADKSGNGRDATAGGPGHYPRWDHALPNALTSARFNTLAYMTTTSFSLSQPFTIVCVGENAAAGAYFHDTISGTSIAQLWASSSALSAGGSHLFGYAGSGSGNGDTASDDTGIDLVSCFIAAGASSQMFINGVQRGTTGQGSATGGISGGLIIGQNQAHGGGVDGQMAHVFCYDHALTMFERVGLDNWIKANTGITF